MSQVVASTTSIKQCEMSQLVNEQLSLRALCYRPNMLGQHSQLPLIGAFFF